MGTLEFVQPRQKRAGRSAMARRGRSASGSLCPYYSSPHEVEGMPFRPHRFICCPTPLPITIGDMKKGLELADGNLWQRELTVYGIMIS